MVAGATGIIDVTGIVTVGIAGVTTIVGGGRNVTGPGVNGGIVAVEMAVVTVGTGLGVTVGTGLGVTVGTGLGVTVGTGLGVGGNTL